MAKAAGKSNGLDPRLPDTPKGRELSEALSRTPVVKIKELRDYQKEAIAEIEARPHGKSQLCVLATGLGKSVVLASLPRTGKVLILSWGTEIVTNVLQYYDCPVGVELSGFRAKRDFPDAEVISASIPSIVRHLEDYEPDEFEYVLVDEAHHSTAPSYQKVIHYFKPTKYLLGFTATPNRSDGVSLGGVFEEVTIQRDIKWGIQNGYLSDIYVRKIALPGLDLRNVRHRAGDDGTEADFSQSELAAVMRGCAPAIAKIYNENAFGPTLIFVASIELAISTAGLIPKSAFITGEMSPQERGSIIESFERGDIECLISVDVLREGVNIPCIQTILACRPTLSSLVYAQMVGRGLRLYPGKKYLNLVEVEGITGEGVTLVSAPALWNVDVSALPPSKRRNFDGVRLSEMDEIAKKSVDTVASWKFAAKHVEAWAEVNGLDLSDVNWVMFPDNHMEVNLPWVIGNEEVTYQLRIPPPDALGRCRFGVIRMPMQMALDLAKVALETCFEAKQPLWDMKIIREKWGVPATDKQKYFIKAHVPNFDVSELTKQQASSIISRLKGEEDDGKEVRQFQFIANQNKAPARYRGKDTIRTSKKGRLKDVYDYDPGKDYIMDQKKTTLRREIWYFIYDIIGRILSAEKWDIESFIDRVNHAQKAAWPSKFMEEHPKYRYLCYLDGELTPRKSIYHWLGLTMDMMVPWCIYDYANGLGGEYKRTLPKINLEEAPYNSITFQYPEARDAFIKASKKRRISKSEREIQAAAKERWAKRELEKQRRKKAKEENMEILPGEQIEIEMK